MALATKSVYFQRYPHLYEPLIKATYERSQNDVQKLFLAMRGVAAFKDMSDFILTEICGAMKYQFVEENKTVFNQGDVGTAWYIILRGKVSVWVKQEEAAQNRINVANLKSGQGFGDLALINDKARGATILTTTNCDLVSVEKSDYLRIIKFIHEKEMKEKVYFLRKVPLLNLWNSAQLTQLAQLMTWKTYEPGTVIQKEGEEMKNFVFVRTGYCDVMRGFKHDGKPMQVLVTRLGGHEYFGEEGAMWAEIKDTDQLPGRTNKSVLQQLSHTARSTVIASGLNADSATKVGIIDIYNARMCLHSLLQLKMFHKWSEEDLYHKYVEGMRRKEVIKLRKDTIDAIMREKFKDPTMTAAKRKVLAKTHHVWK